MHSAQEHVRVFLISVLFLSVVLAVNADVHVMRFLRVGTSVCLQALHRLLVRGPLVQTAWGSGPCK